MDQKECGQKFAEGMIEFLKNTPVEEGKNTPISAIEKFLNNNQDPIANLNTGDLSRIFDEYPFEIPEADDIIEQYEQNSGFTAYMQSFMDEITPQLLNADKTGLNDTIIKAICTLPKNEEDQSRIITLFQKEEVAHAFMQSVLTSYSQKLTDNLEHDVVKSSSAFQTVMPAIQVLADNTTVRGLPENGDQLIDERKAALKELAEDNSLDETQQYDEPPAPPSLFSSVLESIGNAFAAVGQVFSKALEAIGHGVSAVGAFVGNLINGALSMFEGTKDDKSKPLLEGQNPQNETPSPASSGFMDDRIKPVLDHSDDNNLEATAAAEDAHKTSAGLRSENRYSPSVDEIKAELKDVEQYSVWSKRGTEDPIPFEPSQLRSIGPSVSEPNAPEAETNLEESSLSKGP